MVGTILTAGVKMFEKVTFPQGNVTCNSLSLKISYFPLLPPVKYNFPCLNDKTIIK